MLPLRCLSLLGLCVLFGCGGGGPLLSPVTGTVTFKDKAQDGANVRFMPLGDTPGHGGHGVTDEAGKYEITAGQSSRKGLPAGKYKVVISRMRGPGDSKPNPDVPPMESSDKETIPEPYSSARDTPLTATVGEEAKVVDFHLPIKKK